MKQAIQLLLCTIVFTSLEIQASMPLGLFTPYDINLRLKKPAQGRIQCSFLGEKSYKVQGYATDCQEEITFLVNPLQIYEPIQNIISMYQGFDSNGVATQINSGQFTELLNSIAGGPGGGVSNYENGLYVPTGDFSAGQASPGLTYGIGQGFYISAYLPIYFAKLSNVTWTYAGNNTLFSGQKIQEDLINSFQEDAQNLFGLCVGNWKQNGPGDLAFIAEWQRDFPQRRAVLKNVQTNLRVGLSFPTGIKANEHLVMPIPFGADGSMTLPFGGGLGINLANCAEFGFSGQFWYIWGNEKNRRIKIFPTQTSLLFPAIVPTYKDFAFIQNFNIYAQAFSPSKRYSVKVVYQYFRKGKDTLIPQGIAYNFDVANSAIALDETTSHDFFIDLMYTPLRNDFQKIIPQAQFFWKGSFKGMRTSLASTIGAQISLIF